MTAEELTTHLSILQVTQPEAAQLLGVSPRTLRRWLEGEDVPGPAEAALRAWRELAERHLPWKPDSVSIFENDQDQMQRHSRHMQELAAALKRVDARGGAKNPWTVDISRGAATFGPFEVGFYKLQSGNFSVSFYRRKDKEPDATRDMAFIEDAAYCIAKAFGKARDANAALKSVAKYTRDHSSLFARNGPKLLSQAETNRRRRAIEALAGKIDELAALVLEGDGKYDQFESILSELHEVGFFPEISLISEVARAMVV
jgi:hypothetical protein